MPEWHIVTSDRRFSKLATKITRFLAFWPQLFCLTGSKFGYSLMYKCTRRSVDLSSLHKSVSLCSHVAGALQALLGSRGDVFIWSNATNEDVAAKHVVIHTRIPKTNFDTETLLETDNGKVFNHPCGVLMSSTSVIWSLYFIYFK